MNLHFNKVISNGYNSKSQIARVLTENWVLNNSYCPSCGQKQFKNFSNNNPSVDFSCDSCSAEYELKSSRRRFNSKVVDGAYESLIMKIENQTNPNFLFLNYTQNYTVIDFFAVPKRFFIPEIIEKRNPLSPNARRAGWIGCNILITNLPPSGRVFLIRDGKILNPRDVILQWGKTAFLEEFDTINRGWLLEIMSIIDNIPQKEFSIDEIYKYEPLLKKKFPHNNFIKAKVRQQLQFLRDKGYINFINKGNYCKVN